MNILHELIRIKSTDPARTGKAVELAAAYLKENGISGEIIDNEGYKSYVAVVGKGGKTLILNGHLDVVSGKDPQFEPVEEAGKLIARGSADMKGGCVAMMEALIKLSKMDLPCRVMIQLVPDEETGGKYGTAHLIKKGYVGDFVICTEPTNLNPSIQAKGIVRIDVETRGVSAHGSRPWEGVNAIEKAMENYARIEALPILNSGSDFYKRSSVNLALIRGGDIYNRVPDHCTMGIDIRFVPHLDHEEILKEIRRVVDGDVSVVALEPGVNVQPDNPYVQRLKQSVSRILPEKDVILAAQHGGSDARFFTGLGIPAVEFGPVGDFWHGDGEYVEIDSVKQLEDILVDFALNFK
ncbi:MAG: M20/M25/M40 family metallo-hydrolase [Spirochaetales bacterium]|nr:M20/M25/M40 family metallo-hydrolase [Spirochaetales bacterium]